MLNEDPDGQIVDEQMQLDEEKAQQEKTIAHIDNQIKNEAEAGHLHSSLIKEVDANVKIDEQVDNHHDHSKSCTSFNISAKHPGVADMHPKHDQSIDQVNHNNTIPQELKQQIPKVEENVVE